MDPQVKAFLLAERTRQRVLQELLVTRQRVKDLKDPDLKMLALIDREIVAHGGKIPM